METVLIVIATLVVFGPAGLLAMGLWMVFGTIGLIVGAALWWVLVFS